MPDRLSISLPSDLNHEFELLRNRLNLSRSDAIRKAMRMFIVEETRQLEQEMDSHVLGTITYLEQSHVHGHPHNQNAPHQHGSNAPPHVHNSGDNYYFPVEKLEFIKVNDLQHDYLDIITSTTHIHVSAEKCMLIIAVAGSYQRVQALFQALSAFKTIEKIQMSIVERTFESL